MEMFSKIADRLTLQRYLEGMSTQIEKLPAGSLGKNEKKRLNTIHTKFLQLIDILAETTQEFTQEIHVTTTENAGKGKTKIYMKKIYLEESEYGLQYSQSFFKVFVNDNGSLPVNDPKDKNKPKILIFHASDFEDYVNTDGLDISSETFYLTKSKPNFCFECNQFDLTIPIIHPSSKNTYRIHGSHLELPSQWRKESWFGRLDDQYDIIKDFKYYSEKFMAGAKNKDFILSTDL